MGDHLLVDDPGKRDRVVDASRLTGYTEHPRRAGPVAVLPSRDPLPIESHLLAVIE